MDVGENPSLNLIGRVLIRRDTAPFLLVLQPKPPIERAVERPRGVYDASPRELPLRFAPFFRKPCDEVVDRGEVRDFALPGFPEGVDARHAPCVFDVSNSAPR